MLDKNRRVSIDTLKTIDTIKFLYELTGNARLISRITGVSVLTVNDIVKGIDATVFGKKLYESELESLKILSSIKAGKTLKELCSQYNCSAKEINYRTLNTKKFLLELYNTTPAVNDKVIKVSEKDKRAEEFVRLFDEEGMTMTQIADKYNVSLSTVSRSINYYKIKYTDGI